MSEGTRVDFGLLLLGAVCQLRTAAASSHACPEQDLTRVQIHIADSTVSWEIDVCLASFFVQNHHQQQLQASEAARRRMQ